MEFLGRHSRPRGSRDAFTLIELVGVLAIIGILAAALAPNVVRSIERAAARAERDSLAALGQSLEAHLLDRRQLPDPANWAADLSAFAELSESAVAENRRGVARVYIEDPAEDPAQRVLILSSLRPSPSLPAASSISTAAKFQSLWDTPDGAVPDIASWSGWSSWQSVPNAADYLAIQRVNLRPIHLDELRPRDVALNNTTSQTASYQLLDADGNALGSAAIPPETVAHLQNLAKGDRVDVFGDAAGTNLVYSFIVAGESRSFDLSDWIDGNP